MSAAKPLFAFLVEVGRVELPSENAPRKASTGLERLCVHPSGCRRSGAGKTSQSVTSSPEYQLAHTPASPMRCGRHELLGVPHADLAEFSAKEPKLTRQRRRRRSCRCWQLLGCRFLRGQRRLGLRLRLPRPRRNQCTPRKKVKKNLLRQICLLSGHLSSPDRALAPCFRQVASCRRDHGFLRIFGRGHSFAVAQAVAVGSS